MKLVTLLGASIVLVAFSASQFAQNPARPAVSRRSQRIKMPEVRVTSPDGRVAFTLLANAERLTYAVTQDGVPVIQVSPIVMKLDGYDLSTGVVFKSEERSEGKETYPWYGAKSTAVSDYKGATIAITNDLTSVDYVLEIRAFNDGVAYRHVVSGSDTASRVPDEYSAFTIPEGSTVWYGGVADGHYETNYLKKDIADVQAGEWAGPPLTFKLPQNAGYAAITEANLVNYSGMALESEGQRRWIIGLGHRQPLNYPFELRYGREEAKRLGKPAAITGTITTPWRVIMIGRDLNTLVNSTILPNLCPPPDPRLFPDGIKTSWIKPGRAVWRYLDGGPGRPNSADGVKEFSRLAGRLGFEHQVVEGFWSQWTPAERRDVADFSHQQNVDLFFWKHRNQLDTPESQDAFFKLLADSGVSGAKIDFFDHEAKEVIDLYESLLRKAAEHHIMLVFHGANKPTGRQRSWPNEVVREAVRGMESSAVMERARHQTILPYTRYLAGPADYTTMLFNERRRDSTVAHQIATMVVLAGPLLTIAANPTNLLASPAVDVIRKIPSTWDETIVLPGSEIGEAAVFARRSGRRWFLAVMCGPAPRTIPVSLSFLGSGSHSATVIRDDAPDGSTIKVEAATYRASDAISLALRRGGGFLASFD
jgi:alpha-glucosidase